MIRRHGATRRYAACRVLRPSSSRPVIATEEGGLTDWLWVQPVSQLQQCWHRLIIHEAMDGVNCDITTEEYLANLNECMNEWNRQRLLSIRPAHIIISARRRQQQEWNLTSSFVHLGSNMWSKSFFIPDKPKIFGDKRSPSANVGRSSAMKCAGQDTFLWWYCSS